MGKYNECTAGLTFVNQMTLSCDRPEISGLYTFKLKPFGEVLHAFVKCLCSTTCIRELHH